MKQVDFKPSEAQFLRITHTGLCYSNLYRTTTRLPGRLSPVLWALCQWLTNLRISVTVAIEVMVGQTSQSCAFLPGSNIKNSSNINSNRTQCNYPCTCHFAIFLLQGIKAFTTPLVPLSNLDKILKFKCVLFVLVLVLISWFRIYIHLYSYPEGRDHS